MTDDGSIALIYPCHSIGVSVVVINVQFGVPKNCWFSILIQAQGAVLSRGPNRG